jgi:hypothetical protein
MVFEPKYRPPGMQGGKVAVKVMDKKKLLEWSLEESTCPHGSPSCQPPLGKFSAFTYNQSWAHGIFYVRKSQFCNLKEALLQLHIRNL